MKTIKIDKEAYEILALFKVYGGCKTYSETIKQIKRYLEYKNEKIKNLEKNYKENKITPYNVTPQEKEITLPIGIDTNEK